MVFYLTGLGVIVASVLWILTEFWEWSVPKALEEKILEWKKNRYCSQGILSLQTQKPILEQEYFVYSLKQVMPRIEREFGLPVHVEVEVNGPNSRLTEEEKRYIHCLTRSFSEFTWYIKDRTSREAD